MIVYETIDISMTVFKLQNFKEIFVCNDIQ